MAGQASPPSQTSTPLLRRFATRLVLAAVLAVVPLTAVLAIVLVSSSSSALRENSRNALATAASSTAARVDRWAVERRQDASELRLELDAVPASGWNRVLARTTIAAEAIQVLSPDGRVLAARGTRTPLTAPGQEAFDVAARGGAGGTQPAKAQGTIRTLLTRPVAGSAARPAAILVIDLDETVPASYLFDVRVGRTGDADYRIASGLSLYAASMPRPTSPRQMARVPDVLTNDEVSIATRRAQAGQVGAVQWTDYRKHQVVGGYARSVALGWAVAVKQDRSEAFAAVGRQQRLALLIGVVGVLLVIGGALLFARRITAPIAQLAHRARRVAGGDLRARVTPRGPAEVESLGTSFNEMVSSLERLADQIRAAGADMATSSAELSSAAQELAATTTQQSAAATETSSTMEELAQTSARIAETVDTTAGRADETRDALERADEGMAASSERITALADRSVEIGDIVTLINAVADRTDLLALNAAIEAARAGEVGAGFAVVAEEVRLLAERSKAEASKIADIVARTQAETTATVMAMDEGAKEMRRGLDLMDTVSDATSEVRLTTDQQRVATDQVVTTMVSVTTATKQTATTAQQIAQASRGIAQLAASLQDAAFAFRTESMPGGPAAGPGAMGAQPVPVGSVALVPPAMATVREPDAPSVPIGGGGPRPPAPSPSRNGGGAHHDGVPSR